MRRKYKAAFLFSLTGLFVLTGCDKARTAVADEAIASTTLCADGYLQALPEIETRLAALSWQSRSALSRAKAELRDLPQTDDDLERSLQWANAVQISSAGGRGDIDLKWGEDFETVWDNLDTLSASLATPNHTEHFKRRLDSIQKPSRPPRILYLDRSGASAGPGTFVDVVIQAAGGDNIITHPGWQSPDIERLIALQPDLIITSFMDSDYAGVNDRTSRHAALADKIGTVPNIHIPGRYWPCAGPGLVDAAELLNRELLKL